MPSPTPDAAHLVTLIEAAKAEADRIGAPAASVGERLDEAATSAQAMLDRGGRPEEGVRPENLTTGNDQ